MNMIRQIITDLRGGIPDVCDCCGEKRAPEELDPVSGGEWICHECFDRDIKLNGPVG